MDSWPGWTQPWQSSAFWRPIGPGLTYKLLVSLEPAGWLGHILLVLITEAQQSKSKHRRTFQVFACVPSAKMPLGKGSHVTAQIQGVGKKTPLVGRTIWKTQKWSVGTITQPYRRLFTELQWNGMPLASLRVVRSRGHMKIIFTFSALFMLKICFLI